jgi:phosphohistidine phosphatase
MHLQGSARVRLVSGSVTDPRTDFNGLHRREECRYCVAVTASPTLDSMPMQLLIIRHAIAEDRDEFALTGKPDGLRPLTPLGRKRMRRATPALQRLVPSVGIVASSPLARAQQTAEIVASGYRDARLETVTELSPDERLPRFRGWLRGQPDERPIAVVGHEPHLSHLVSWLLAGRFTSFVTLRKGAACLLEFPSEPAPGEAQLHWLLQPRQLRRLARGAAERK